MTLATRQIEIETPSLARKILPMLANVESDLFFDRPYHNIESHKNKTVLHIYNVPASECKCKTKAVWIFHSLQQSQKSGSRRGRG